MSQRSQKCKLKMLSKAGLKEEKEGEENEKPLFKINNYYYYYFVFITC